MRGAILRGSGPAPEGYVGPCSCDPELGSHFHRYDAREVPKRRGDYVAGARLTPDGAVAVLSCGCEDREHRVGGVYYSSVRHNGHYVALSGPYETHSEALAAVAGDRAWAQEVDPRAPWYAYGTFGTARGVAVKVARAKGER